jgi:hypothetical protein
MNKKRESPMHDGQEDETDIPPPAVDGDLSCSTAATETAKKHKASTPPAKITLNVANRHPHDDKVTFHENGHFYVNEEGKRFRISTTGWLGLFCKPFDEEACILSKFQNPGTNDRGEKVVGMSERGKTKPEDFGLTRKECILKMRWKAAFGTMMHGKIERYLDEVQGASYGAFMGMPIEMRQHLLLYGGDEAGPVTEQQFKCSLQMLRAEDQWQREGWRPYRAEWTIFSKPLCKAGQIDLVLIRYTPTGTAEYMVLDWKTTEKRPGDLKDWKCPNMYHPVEHVCHTYANSYKLQMSDYASVLINEYGLNVVEVRAIILNPYKDIGHMITARPMLEEIKMMSSVWSAYLSFESLLVDWERNKQRSPILPEQTRPQFYAYKPQPSKATAE